MLDDFFREVKRLPPLVWNATHLEHLATGLEGSDAPWSRGAAITALDVATTIYRRLSNLERAAHTDARRLALAAEGGVT